MVSDINFVYFMASKPGNLYEIEIKKRKHAIPGLLQLEFEVRAG
jgi:hypothetical protein